jgi:serine protease inhibitor
MKMGKSLKFWMGWAILAFFIASVHLFSQETETIISPSTRQTPKLCPDSFDKQSEVPFSFLSKSGSKMQFSLAKNAKYALAPVSDNTNSLISNIISANTRFGFKLFKEIVEQEGEKNIFISPLSVSIALAMTYNGAAGETEKAMAKTLELQEMSLLEVNRANAKLSDSLLNPDSGIQLNLANSLWAHKSVEFRKAFMKNNQEFYKAQIRNLDLSDPRSLEIINRWGKEKTQGKIDEIVDPSDLDAILFLINAVYFKGAWSVGFSKEYTKERDFTLLDGSRKRVPMMMSQSDRYSYYRGDSFQAVELPYGNEKTSLYLFLPDRESSLQEFCQKLNRDSWESWMSGFRRELVGVVLPRLRLEYEIKLNVVLKALGMGIAFTSRANFEKMCTGTAFIDYVAHKSFADVNEEGTEAAAVTVVKMKRGGHQTLVFDRPFFLAIRDNVTGAILFMGLIIKP